MHRAIRAPLGFMRWFAFHRLVQLRSLASGCVTQRSAALPEDVTDTLIAAVRVGPTGSLATIAGGSSRRGHDVIPCQRPPRYTLLLLPYVSFTLPSTTKSRIIAK